MAFCANCGAQVDGRFCPKCGAPAGAAGAAATPEAGTVPGAQPYTAGSATASSGITDNVAGALCYAIGLVTGILFLVIPPYNQNKLIRFHAFQSIFFHVAWIGFWIAEAILAMTLPWGLHFVVTMLSLLVSLGGLLVWLLLMYKAYSNEKFKLPIIGDLAEKQA